MTSAIWLVILGSFLPWAFASNPSPNPDGPCSYVPVGNLKLVPDAPCQYTYDGPKIVVVGDIHGDLETTLLLLYSAGLVDANANWIGANAILVQVGDILDRGPHGKTIIDFFEVLKTQARASQGNVFTLLGNHELLDICGRFIYVNPEERTLFGAPSERRFHFGPQGYYGKILRKWPVALKVNDTVFVHAGMLPPFCQLNFDELHRFTWKALANDCYLLYSHPNLPGHPMAPDEKLAYDIAGQAGLFWLRAYSMGDEATVCPLIEEALKLLGASRMVVGHTITQGPINLRCGGKFVMIDTGLSAWVKSSPSALVIENKSGEWTLFDLSFAADVSFTFSATNQRIQPPAVDQAIQVAGLRLYKRKLVESSVEDET